MGVGVPTPILHLRTEVGGGSADLDFTPSHAFYCFARRGKGVCRLQFYTRCEGCDENRVRRE